MKKSLKMTMAVTVLLALGMALCCGFAAAEQANWTYDEGTKTLYVNADMGAFEPDIPDFDGATSNAPWAAYLPEVENIVVGDDVTEIGDYAFAFCPNLKNVEVGQNVTALDNRCFFKCGDFDNDSSIDFHFNSMPAFVGGFVDGDIFGYTWDNPNAIIYVPDDMKEYWAEFILQKGEMGLDGYELDRSGQDDSGMLLFDYVVASILNNEQFLWYEGSGGFAENQGGEFGGGAAEKRYNENEGRLELISDNNDACVPFNTTLRDCGSDDRQQQAILIRFQPENAPDFNFFFFGPDEINLGFSDSGPELFDMARGSSTKFSDYIPNTFEVKGDSIYYMLFAADDNAMLRVFIWEEGNIEENQAYIEYDLYNGDDAIYDCHWKMNIWFGPNGQFNIYEYWVYTFDAFREDLSRFVSSDDNRQSDMANEANDYGPAWNINIADNFMVVSDAIWQHVDPQPVYVGGGDEYIGYGLKDLLDFTGNGSTVATVWFSHDGENNMLVEPTYDAYVVFIKNGEFMGAPYLITIDGVSQDPVTDVYP